MLRKCDEMMPTGRKVCRIAYAVTAGALPSAEQNSVWMEDPNFQPHQALRTTRDWNRCFERLSKGAAIVLTP